MAGPHAQLDKTMAHLLFVTYTQAAVCVEMTDEVNLTTGV